MLGFGGESWRIGVGDVTQLLEQVSGGDQSAEDQLLRIVHEELRRLAASKLAREMPGHTLQTTALVNEAYIRLLGGNSPKEEGQRENLLAESESTQDSSIHWDSRSHFFAAAAEAMRRILIDNARRKKRQKRGGNNKQVPMDDVEFQVETSDFDLEVLDKALEKLESHNADHAAVVKLRYFAGMTIEQTAEALGISPATVKRSWAYSRAWLRREIGD